MMGGAYISVIEGGKRVLVWVPSGMTVSSTAVLEQATVPRLISEGWLVYDSANEGAWCLKSPLRTLQEALDALAVKLRMEQGA